MKARPSHPPNYLERTIPPVFLILRICRLHHTHCQNRRTVGKLNIHLATNMQQYRYTNSTNWSQNGELKYGRAGGTLIHWIVSIRYPGVVQTARTFMSRVEQRIEKTYGREVNPLSVTGYVEAPLAYDAVWALALALNSTQARYYYTCLLYNLFSYSASS